MRNEVTRAPPNAGVVVTYPPVGAALAVKVISANDALLVLFTGVTVSRNKYALPPRKVFGPIHSGNRILFCVSTALKVFEAVVRAEKGTSAPRAVVTVHTLDKATELDKKPLTMSLDAGSNRVKVEMIDNSAPAAWGTTLTVLLADRPLEVTITV